jgi:hypothetical protein
MLDYSEVNGFLSSRFPCYAFAFLYGSHVKGNARPDSDVDLIVIFDSEDVSSHREIVRHGAHIYDVSVLSLAGMKAFLSQAPVTCNYRPAYMLENAVVLPSSGPVAESLIKQARQLLREMQRPATTDSFRLYFTSLLADLRYADSRSERIFLMTDAYRTMGEFVSHWHGRRGGRKHAFETIQRFEPSFLAELNDVFTTALRDDEVAPFVLFADRFLKNIGGPLTMGYFD